MSKANRNLSLCLIMISLMAGNAHFGLMSMLSIGNVNFILTAVLLIPLIALVTESVDDFLSAVLR